MPVLYLFEVHYNLVKFHPTLISSQGCWKEGLTGGEWGCNEPDHEQIIEYIEETSQISAHFLRSLVRSV